MNKKILITLICLIFGIMILALTGCGDNTVSISTDDKEQIVKEIESYIKQDRKSLSTDYRDSYEVTVTDIEIEGLTATFSGKIKIKYFDGSRNDNVTFEGSTSLKSDSYSIYKTNVDYNY